MELLVVLTVWGLMSWGVASLANSRGRSGFGFFLLSFFFSPLLGLIVVLVMKNLTEVSTAEFYRRQEEDRREQDRKREHEKQLESLRALTAAQSTKSPPQAADSQKGLSIADELTKLADLANKGVLSSEEFDEQKRRLLTRPPGG